MAHSVDIVSHLHCDYLAAQHINSDLQSHRMCGTVHITSTLNWFTSFYCEPCMHAALRYSRYRYTCYHHSHCVSLYCYSVETCDFPGLNSLFYVGQDVRTIECLERERALSSRAGLSIPLLQITHWHLILYRSRTWHCITIPIPYRKAFVRARSVVVRT